MPSPPAIDGPSVTTSTQTGGTTGTISLTTAATNEVALLFIEVGTTGAAITTGVSGGGLTWTKRKSVINTTLAYALTEVWSAPVPSIVAGATITVTTSGTMDDMALVIAAFSGCSAQIFDSDASLPAGPVTTGTSTIPITINTTQTDDMVLGILGTNASNVGAVSVDGGALFTQLAKVSNTGGTHFAGLVVQWNTYTSPQSGLSFSFGGTAGTASMLVVADALTANGISGAGGNFMFAT